MGCARPKTKAQPSFTNARPAKLSRPRSNGPLGSAPPPQGKHELRITVTIHAGSATIEDGGKGRAVPATDLEISATVVFYKLTERPSLKLRSTTCSAEPGGAAMPAARGQSGGSPGAGPGAVRTGLTAAVQRAACHQSGRRPAGPAADGARAAVHPPAVCPNALRPAALPIWLSKVTMQVSDMWPDPVPAPGGLGALFKPVFHVWGNFVEVRPRAVPHSGA